MVIEIIKFDDFYKEVYKIIYECMIILSNKGEFIDLIILIEELRK